MTAVAGPVIVRWSTSPTLRPWPVLARGAGRECLACCVPRGPRPLISSVLLLPRTRSATPAMLCLLAVMTSLPIFTLHWYLFAAWLAEPVVTGKPLGWWWDIWVRVICDMVVVFFAIALFFIFGLMERRHRELEELSRYDTLTGLLNRGSFMRLLEEEFGKQLRSRRPACVMMCDVDLFKRINDVHGHPAGDAVLARLGQVLGAAVRQPIDVPARFGARSSWCGCRKRRCRRRRWWPSASATCWRPKPSMARGQVWHRHRHRHRRVQRWRWRTRPARGRRQPLSRQAGWARCRGGLADVSGGLMRAWRTPHPACDGCRNRRGLRSQI